MSRRIGLIALIALTSLVSRPGLVGAQGGQQDKIRAVVAEWKKRQARVNTLVCSAKVESFYPKGYLSTRFTPEKGAEAKNEPSPGEDMRLTNEPISWEIDFASARVRKEYKVTRPYDRGDDSELAHEYALHLLKDGKYRLFRPRDTYPEKSRQGGLAPDVTLYEQASHAFLLSFTDLPLLWTAGGVSGEYPLPDRMKHLAEPSRFSHRGEAQWEGQPCMILTIQEQDNPKAVREYWVGVQPPYPILFCKARSGNDVRWQQDIRYTTRDDVLVPAEWTYTEYNRGGKTFSRHKYVVEKMEINAPLSADRFEKSLEPGTVAFSVPKNTPYGVMEDGTLGPVGDRPSPRGWVGILAWVGLGAAVVLVTALVWRRRRAGSNP